MDFNGNRMRDSGKCFPHFQKNEFVLFALKTFPSVIEIKTDPEKVLEVPIGI